MSESKGGSEPLIVCPACGEPKPASGYLHGSALCADCRGGEREGGKAAGFDPVANPAHYAGHAGIECKRALESMLGTGGYVAYMQGCAFKYLWRWRGKNGAEDLRKARECVGLMLDALGVERDG